MNIKGGSFFGLIISLTFFSRIIAHKDAHPLYLEALKSGKTDGPLGLTSGRIEHWQITASSTYPADWDSACHEKYARLYSPDGMAWCSKHKSASEWIQIDLAMPAKVTGFMTQGRGDGVEWVSAFHVSHSLDGFLWSYVQDNYGNHRVFEGNSDSYRVKHAYLDEPVIARYVKLHTLEWNKHPSMRIEILGYQACLTVIGHPPYVVLTSSSENSNEYMTCNSEDGYLVTHKAWCPAQNNDRQWLQMDIGGPSILITGLVTKGRGDTRKRQWVSKYTVSYSNDSKTWQFYRDSESVPIKEFSGNLDKESSRSHFLNRPILARYVRFHPLEWRKQIAMRVGVIGCPHAGECGQNFVRVTDGTVCVENLAFGKRTWLLNEKGPAGDNSVNSVAAMSQVKRHVKHHRSAGLVESYLSAISGLSAAGRVSANATSTPLQSCIQLENAHADAPAWLLDLGEVTQISGVILYTTDLTYDSGSPTKSKTSSMPQNLDRLTVYTIRPPSLTLTSPKIRHPLHQHKKGRNPFAPAPTELQWLECGNVTRMNEAVYKARLHLPCLGGSRLARYVLVEAAGFKAKWSRLFRANLCDITVYS